MGFLEIVLLVAIVALVIVLAVETNEYRKAREFTASLQGAISAYSAGYTVMAQTVQAIQEAFGEMSESQTELSEEIVRQGALLELHNKAIGLSPLLVRKSDDE